MTKTKDKPLTVVRLTASNVMRLKAGLEIVPNGNVVTLTGKNKQGKSDVLNCILFALGGKAVLPEKPVRTGAMRADVHVDLGEIVIDWKCSAGGTVTLLVRDREKGEVKAPQSALNELWNLMCDPGKFIRLSDTPEGRRRQAETLRKIVGLDFSALDEERLKLYAEREDKNRELKKSQARQSEMPFHGDTPEQEISVTELLEQMAKAQAHNETVNAAGRNLERLASHVNDATEDLGRLESRLKELLENVEDVRKDIEHTKGIVSNATKEHDDYKAQLNTMALEDVTTVQTKIKSSDALNRKVRENAARRKVDKEVAELDNRVQVLTRQMEEIDEEKSNKLKAAKFPVDGLSFNEDGILLEGVPFNQGSQAEQLLAATAIALALKPRIRVVLLRDASLLDSDTRRQVAELATREGAQVWEEIVDSNEPGAIIIEDGKIKEATDEAA